MKKFTIDKSIIQNFNDFKKQYENSKEATPEEEKIILEKIKEFKIMKKKFDAH